jgi:hypothetical protein
MNKRRWFILVTLAVFLLSAMSPALAAGSSLKVPLVINNNAGQFIPVKLSGPADYSFDVPSGTSTKFVLNGLYHYSVSGCGDKKKGAVVTTPSGGKLNINICRPVNLYILNHTGARLGLSLVGPRNYFFSLPEGLTKLRVLGGTYDFTGYACGTTKSGGFKVSGGNYWKWECPE